MRPVTIRKGEEWTRRGPLPPGGVVVRDDAEAHHVIAAARRSNLAVPPLGLLGGDLCHTLGGVGDEARLHSDHATIGVCDLGWALLDGKIHWFASSLVAHHRWWRGRAFVAMNAAWLGPWNVAPASHPADGLLETAEVEIPLTQLLAVRRRLPQGAHLPHPGIRVRRTAATQVELDRPTPVWLDGVPAGRVRTISVRVEPDALTVVV
jgi:hypothetical protein